MIYIMLHAMWYVIQIIMQDEVLNARPNATLGTIRNEDWKVMVNLKDPGGPNG